MNSATIQHFLHWMLLVIHTTRMKGIMMGVWVMTAASSMESKLSKYFSNDLRKCTGTGMSLYVMSLEVACHFDVR